MKADTREDGGGTRAYWTLLVLERLMIAAVSEEIRQGRIVDGQRFWPRYLPCHYFDLICGSSTGAYVNPMRMVTRTAKVV
jgi:hypothetical protein